MVLLYAIVGILVGGVLNALADTLPSRTRLRTPYCAYCDAAHRPVAWLATTGWLLARGRCANCDAPLPLRGVLVELATAVVYVYLYTRFGLTGYMLLLSAYLAILILITVIDLEHRLVLNRVIGPAILLALVAGPFTPDLNWKQVLVGGLVAFGLFYLVALIYPDGMGAGDVKLAAFVGLITGFPTVFVALLIGIFAGGLVSLVLILSRLRSRRDYIPYGPFLVIGGAYALLWGQPLVDDYLELDQQARATEPALVQAAHAGSGWALVSSPVEALAGSGCSASQQSAHITPLLPNLEVQPGALVQGLPSVLDQDLSRRRPSPVPGLDLHHRPGPNPGRHSHRIPPTGRAVRAS